MGGKCIKARFTTSVPKELLDYIEVYRKRNRIEYLSQAVVAILSLGLAEIETGMKLQTWTGAKRGGVRVTITLSDSQLESVENYRFENRIDTRARAIVDLLAIGKEVAIRDCLEGEDPANALDE